MRTAAGDPNTGATVPAGWTVSSPVSAGDIWPGKSATATFQVTPPAAASGGNGLVATATYGAPDDASGSVSAEQWVIAQRPLPLPPGATNLSLSATASASSTSPWTTISAINNGIYPIQSSDDGNLTPYWGDWPAVGQHWVELDWTAPITTNASEIYWADDGGGLRVPSTWMVQYWDGSAWQNVANQSGQPVALDTFNNVTFDPVTTSKLRVLMQSNGTASVGMIQWVVPSIP